MVSMGTEIEGVQDPRDPRVDEIIWKHIGLKSVREIAELCGESPEVVLRRKRELLEEIDVLTIQEKRQRLLVELDGLAREARERARLVSDEFFSGALNSSVAAMKAILVELARAEKSDSSAVDTLNQMRVQELVALMNAVVISGVQEVSDTYDLDEDELYEIFNARLIDEAGKRDLH